VLKDFSNSVLIARQKELLKEEGYLNYLDELSNDLALIGYGSEFIDIRKALSDVNRKNSFLINMAPTLSGDYSDEYSIARRLESNCYTLLGAGAGIVKKFTSRYDCYQYALKSKLKIPCWWPAKSFLTEIWSADGLSDKYVIKHKTAHGFLRINKTIDLRRKDVFEWLSRYSINDLVVEKMIVGEEYRVVVWKGKSGNGGLTAGLVGSRNIYSAQTDQLASRAFLSKWGELIGNAFTENNDRIFFAIDCILDADVPTVIDVNVNPGMSSKGLLTTVLRNFNQDRFNLLNMLLR